MTAPKPKVEAPKPVEEPKFVAPVETPTEVPVAAFGGHGLFSTAADYARFCGVLLRGGGVGGWGPAGCTADELPGRLTPS